MIFIEMNLCKNKMEKSTNIILLDMDECTKMHV